MTYKKALERLNLALGQDKDIGCALNEVNSHPGNDPQYLDDLGLEKRFLTRLETAGRAIRGYKPTKQGYKLQWWLIIGPVRDVMSPNNTFSQRPELKDEKDAPTA